MLSASLNKTFPSIPVIKTISYFYFYFYIIESSTFLDFKAVQKVFFYYLFFVGEVKLYEKM